MSEGHLTVREWLSAQATTVRVTSALLARTVIHLYRTKLHQVPWDRRMFADGHPGGHIGWTMPGFVRKWPARIIAAHRRGKPAEF